jgi:hypothetical protein
VEAERLSLGERDLDRDSEAAPSHGLLPFSVEDATTDAILFLPLLFVTVDDDGIFTRYQIDKRTGFSIKTSNHNFSLNSLRKFCSKL